MSLSHKSPPSASRVRKATRRLSGLGGGNFNPASFLPSESAYALSGEAEARLRGQRIKEEDLRLAGGAFSAEQVRSLLGIDRQTMTRMVEDQALLAVPGPTGEPWVFPAAQFAENGVVDGLQAVLAAAPSTDAWVRLNILVRPIPELGYQSILDCLKAGNTAGPLHVLKGYGKHLAT